VSGQSGDEQDDRPVGPPACHPRDRALREPLGAGRSDPRPRATAHRLRALRAHALRTATRGPRGRAGARIRAPAGGCARADPRQGRGPHGLGGRAPGAGPGGRRGGGPALRAGPGDGALQSGRPAGRGRGGRRRDQRRVGATRRLHRRAREHAHGPGGAGGARDRRHAGPAPPEGARPTARRPPPDQSPGQRASGPGRDAPCHPLRHRRDAPRGARGAAAPGPCGCGPSKDTSPRWRTWRSPSGRG